MPAPTLDLRSVAEGTPVLTADGRAFGTVGNILQDLPDLSPVDVGGPRGVFATPIPGGYGAGESVYFKVAPHDQTRHTGVQTYYVPLMAVAEADRVAVRLTLRAEEAPHQGWNEPPTALPGM